VREGLPMTFGLKVVYTSRWVDPVVVTGTLYVVAIAAVIIGCVRPWKGGGLVVVALAAFPLLHAVLPFAGTVAEGRYTLFVLPLVALALANAAGRRAALAVLLACCLAVTLIGLRALEGNTTPYFSSRRVPTSFVSLERALAEHGTTRLWSNYWVAYRLTFETHERVIAAAVVNDRYPPFARDVASADPPAAHVFLTGTRDDVAFRAGLLARRIGYRLYQAGSQWTVYLPDRAVGPRAIPGSYP
jgi:hypothetical protein